MSYYVTNDNSFLDIKNAHLRVTGNVHTDVMKLGAVEFAPSQSTVAGTVNFTNVTTGVTTSSNLSVGGTLSLGTVEVVATTHTLANTTAVGNVTPHTIQFSNVTTGIVTTANVEVGGDLTVTGNVAVDTDTLFIDSTNNRVGIGTTSPQQKLDLGDLGGGSIRLGRDHDDDNTSTNRIGRTGVGNATWYASVNFLDENTNDDAISFVTHQGNVGIAERMRISGNGNVGIGTTSPVEKFHLYGSPIIQHSLTNFTGTDNSWHIVGTWDATGPSPTQKGGTLHLTFLGGQLFGSNPAGKSEILAKVGNGSAYRSILWKVEGEKIFTDVRMRRVSTDAYKYDICVKMKHYTNHTMRTECSLTTSFERRFTSTTEPSSTDTTNVELGTTLPSTNTSGNLGIGTTSPGAALDILKSATYTNLLRLGVTSGGTGIKFHCGTGGADVWASTGIPLTVNNSGGGTVLFIANINWSNGNSTASCFYMIRKRYDGGFDSTNIANLGGQTVSFQNSGNYLQYKISTAGNGHFYAIEFD